MERAVCITNCIKAMVRSAAALYVKIDNYLRFCNKLSRHNLDFTTDP